MDEQRIKVLLRNLGFSEWEANAYWILVKHGEQTAVGLCRLSKIARSKTYEVISRLRKKGLVMKIPAMPQKGVTQKFVAIDPEKVFFSKIEDMRELSKSLEEMYKNPIEPRYTKINMYTSREAVRELFFDICRNSKFFYAYLANMDVAQVLGYSLGHMLKMIRKKKHFFLLNDVDPKKLGIKKCAFIKSGKMSYIICSDRVILDMYKEQHVFLEIISQEAVETFMDLFLTKAKIKR